MQFARVWDIKNIRYIIILSITTSFFLTISSVNAFEQYSYEELWKLDKSARIGELKKEIEIISTTLSSVGYRSSDPSFYESLRKIAEIKYRIKKIIEEETPLLVYTERFLPYADEYDYLDKAVLELLPYVESEEDAEKYPLVSMAIEKGERRKNAIQGIVSPELQSKVEKEQRILKAKIFASIGVSLIPIVGGVKDYYDYKGGVDVIADIPLSSWEKDMAPFFIGASVFDLSILKSAKKIKYVSRVGRIAEESQTLSELRRFASKLEVGRATSWVTFKVLSKVKSSAESVLNGLYRTLYFARRPLKSIDEIFEGLKVGKSGTRTLIVSPGFGNVRMSRSVLDFLKTKYDRVVEVTLEEGRAVLKPLYSENHIFLSVGGTGIAHNRSAETLGNLFYERLALLKERGLIGENISLLGHSYAGLYHRVFLGRLGKEGGFVVDDVISIGGTHFVTGSIANQVDPIRQLIKEGVRHSMYAKSAIQSMTDEGVALLNRLYPIDTRVISGRYVLVGSEITHEVGALLQRVVTKIEKGDGIVKSEAQLARGVPIVGDESKVERILLRGPNHYQQTYDSSLFERIFEQLGK